MLETQWRQLHLSCVCIDVYHLQFSLIFSLFLSIFFVVVVRNTEYCSSLQFLFPRSRYLRGLSLCTVYLFVVARATFAFVVFPMNLLMVLTTVLNGFASTTFQTRVTSTTHLTSTNGHTEGCMYSLEEEWFVIIFIFLSKR